jgi:hypothetical protein
MDATITCAAQWWTLRNRFATGIDSISCTLAYACGTVCPFNSTSAFDGT